MKRILNIIAILQYVSQCITAITKGAEQVASNWPTTSPFNSSISDEKKDMGDGQA